MKPEDDAKKKKVKKAPRKNDEEAAKGEDQSLSSFEFDNVFDMNHNPITKEPEDKGG